MRTKNQEARWQKVREEIAALIRSRIDPINWTYEIAGAILGLPKIRIEDKDQTLPDMRLPTFLSGNKSLEIAMSSIARHIQGNVVKSGFVRVLPK